MSKLAQLAVKLPACQPAAHSCQTVRQNAQGRISGDHLELGSQASLYAAVK